MSADSRTLAATRDGIERLPRAFAAAGIGGVLVGVPAGLLIRLVMKVSAVAAGPASEGARTDNGNVVGALTAEGTLAIVIFAGLASAVSGAVLYMAVRPWLLPFGQWRGAVLGLYLLALGGSSVLDPFNPDFTRFGPAPLNVAMFCALFLAVGIALAPVTDGALARVSGGQPVLLGFGFLVGVLGAGALAAVAVGILWSWLTNGFVPSDEIAFLLVGGAAAIGLLARLRGVTRLSYLTLGIPLAAGIWMTGNAIAAILVNLAN